MEKIRGLKIYSEKIRGLKILGLSEENAPGGYFPLEMSAPCIEEGVYINYLPRGFFPMKSVASWNRWH